MDFYISLFITLVVYAYTYKKYRTYINKELKELVGVTEDDGVLPTLIIRIGIVVLLITLILAPYINIVTSILTYRTFKEYAELESE